MTESSPRQTSAPGAAFSTMGGDQTFAAQPSNARSADRLKSRKRTVDLGTADLSGGPKRRVTVARLLINGPNLMLADLPTGNLDRASAMEVMDLIGQIKRDEGTAFLISTLDEKIAGLCRRQIVVGVVSG